MNQWLYVVLVCVATHRATRLVTYDDFPPILLARMWVRQHGKPWMNDLITCPWCAGVWLAGAITWLTDQFVHGGLPAPVLVWAAAAAVAGWLGKADGNSNDDGPDDGYTKWREGRDGNTIGPQPSITERMPTRRMSFAQLRVGDALGTVGVVCLATGLGIWFGPGPALVVTGALLLGLGLAATLQSTNLALRASALSSSERTRKAA